MASDFDVRVGLDVPLSEEEIKKDLPKLKRRLDANKEARLKLTAELDLNKTQKLIKSQLQSISKSNTLPKLNLDVVLNGTSTIKNTVSQTIKDIETSAKSSNDISKVIFNADELKKQERHYVSKVTNALESVKRHYLKQGAQDVQFLSFENSTGQLQKFIATVDYGAGIIKKFNYEKARIDTGGAKPNNGYVQTDFVTTSDKAMTNYQKTLNFLNTIDKRVADINSKTLNQARPLQEGTQYYDNYINKLNQVLSTIDSVKKSNAALTDEEKRNIGLMINELKNYAKEQQSAAYPPTKLASVSIDDSVKKYTAELATLEQKWKSQGILVGDFKTTIDNLKTSLSNIGDKSSLTSFITDLSVAKQTATQLFRELQSDNKKTKSLDEIKAKATSAVSELNKLFNNTQLNKSSKNPQVQQLKADIQSLIADYQKLMTTIQTTNPADSVGMANLSAELNTLKSRFDVASKSAKDLQAALKNTQGTENLTAKIKVLQNQLIAYKNANSKAMNSSKLSSNNITFAQEIDTMLAKLKQGVDPAMYQQIANNFRIIKSEVKALGLEGSGWIGQLWANMKKFASWMGMTTVMSRFAMECRQAVTELKEIDTLLTEISKANDKLSQSQLKQIGLNSFDVASKYGKTATDYLAGVQEASRAGYENAEAMAELSTAAQGAGDMTADVANQFIIATDKAYKYKGSVEELTKVLDGVNYITNHNAVNMTELSEGLTIVGSTAASFGVEANELTAALGTMAATTQQSGSEVARAFKAILLNIRQVSDEEENIDAEGLTKYEKACNALGVSLKETKNGVLQLRDPMEVLKELSIEYNKLSETDIKRTNLLNAVGSKLRSTQLDALLRQWDMYEEMLQQYENGSGSMARESEKTAESWQGKLNELSNEFSKFINNFANSNISKSIIEGGTIAIKTLDKIVNLLGEIPTIITTIVGITAAKGSGRSKIDSPHKYARIALLVTVNEIKPKMVA